MTPMPVTDAAPAWRRFCERYLTAVQEVSGSLPITEHDPDTRSPCEVGEPDEHGTVMWRPVSRRPRSDLAAVQRQANVTLPAEVRDWLGGWWCLPIEATLLGEPMVLLGIASPEDEAALGARWAQHLAARRLRHAEDTVPIGAFMNGRFLSVTCPQGEVRMESPSRSLGFVAGSLGDFFEMLIPQAP